jgi:predicted transposase YbfD/YdcC
VTDKKMTSICPKNAYSERFSAIFAKLKDPRRTGKGNIKYPLTEILFLSVSSVLCGYSDFSCMEEFGELNLDWLRKYYPYANGTCSHDVIGKLFQKLDHQQFSDCFMQWSKDCYKLTEGELISIDGKRIRGSHDAHSNKLADHIVSAYMGSKSICLGQVATEEKSNEITAIPQLLDAIDIQGAIISIDAMGCQKGIAEKIVGKKADYLLAVKENHAYLYDDMVDLFGASLPSQSSTTINNGHGRVEKRRATVLAGALLDKCEEWPNLALLAKIDTERYVKSTGKTSFETRFYICSRKHATPEQVNLWAREHWAIENNLHWQLDVNFGEDDARKRIGNSAKNFNLILKTALAIHQRDKTKNRSIKRKGLRASYDIGYRETLMMV